MTPEETKAIETTRRRLADIGADLRAAEQARANLVKPRGRAATETPLPRLTGTQEDILRALTDEPQTAPAVASRAGHSYSGWFRQNLGDLVELGLARRTRHGYQRT